ncbi:MAG: ABC transporter substrate-binding protein [Gammaproteobacteria bacterium]|nr:ABC transporter substrate-binding protein [Gammaproteobacteria bacterium]NIR85282.1 ABC transporter substrate-binding protein [Gammaproteobacteria bacterium]NIR88398.1 ABC transporter substrate-binding protein [Gammaproteobacteria bacterium]NIU06348.1 ABC transporter substrate-binding protein [Gammaproteobacteria bacterium]NIV53247.1 ABC transporter substrate-binding protein [Gammaproteobacteria bacterium]
MTRLTAALRLMLAAVAGLAVASAAMSKEEGVVLGMIAPLTGTNAVQGQDMERGMRLALNRVSGGYEVPLKGDRTRSIGPGVLGNPVQVIVENTESRPASAMDAVRKLVNVDKVPAVIGEYSSGVSVPTGQFTNENKVVQISVASTSPKLREIGPYMFNAIGLDNVGGAELAEFAMKDSGAKRFASIVPNNPFGIGIEISTCKTVEEMGGECVSKIRYELGKPDYRAEVRQLFAANPEAAFYTAYGTESRLILRQAFEQGLEPPKGWYADYMTMWSNELKEIPEAAEGVKGWVVGVSGDFFRREYAEAYEQEYGEPPTTAFGAYAYDATMLLLLAIDEAGSADADAIRQALPKVSESYLGVTGDKSMDEDGMQVTESYQTRAYTKGRLVEYP